MTTAGTPKTTSAPVPAPPVRRHHRAPSIDPLSDRATETLIRKVLLPRETGDIGRDSPGRIHELLPPLTSRNDVDLQLYAFLAIILREFVQAWYSKMTPDETFVAEIVHVIAHCTRTLEQRIRAVDLETLIFHEVPEVLDKHINIYRSTHDNESGSQTVQVHGREAYHALWPLPFLSPAPIPGDPLGQAKQLNNEAAYRQLLVQAVLTVLLPTEDLENPCLTALVGQIFSELIIGNVIADKASQPWLLYEAICIAGRVVAGQREGNHRTKSSRDAKRPVTKRWKWTVHGLVLSIIQFLMLVTSAIRFTFNVVVMSSSLPSRAAPSRGKTIAAEKDDTFNGEGSTAEKVAVLSFNIWRLLGNMIELPARMPWLHGLLSLIQFGAMHGPGRIARLDGALDRLLSHRLQLVFSPSHLPPLLRALRSALFPNNAPGSSSLVAPSSEAELEALRRRAAAALCPMVPPRLGKMYFGGAALGAAVADHGPDEQVMLGQVQGLLGVLDDVYCNKHLMYSILELVLVRLMPELQERGVDELLQERLGEVG